MKISAGWEEYANFRSRTIYDRAKQLVASGKQGWFDMSPVHVLSLLERFPVLYREAWVTPTNRTSRFAQDGFEIRDGWFSIADRLSAKLSADPNLHVWQFKEKMGRLTVYFCDGDATADPALDAMTDAALDEAADESMRTCELCGQPGTLDKREHTVCVRCESCCREEEKARQP